MSALSTWKGGAEDPEMASLMQTFARPERIESGGKPKIFYIGLALPPKRFFGLIFDPLLAQPPTEAVTSLRYTLAIRGASAPSRPLSYTGTDNASRYGHFGQGQAPTCTLRQSGPRVLADLRGSIWSPSFSIHFSKLRHRVVASICQLENRIFELKMGSTI